MERGSQGPQDGLRTVRVASEHWLPLKVAGRPRPGTRVGLVEARPRPRWLGRCRRRLSRRRAVSFRTESPSFSAATSVTRPAGPSGRRAAAPARRRSEDGVLRGPRGPLRPPRLPLPPPRLPASEPSAFGPRRDAALASGAVPVRSSVQAAGPSARPQRGVRRSGALRLLRGVPPCSQRGSCRRKPSPRLSPQLRRVSLSIQSEGPGTLPFTGALRHRCGVVRWPVSGLCLGERGGRGEGDGDGRWVELSGRAPRRLVKFADFGGCRLRCPRAGVPHLQAADRYQPVGCWQPGRTAGGGRAKRPVLASPLGSTAGPHAQSPTGAPDPGPQRLGTAALKQVQR